MHIPQHGSASILCCIFNFLSMQTAGGPCRFIQPFRLRVSKTFQRLDETTTYKPFSKKLSTTYIQRSDAGGNIARFLVKVGSGSGIPLESGHESSGNKSIWESIRHHIDVFYRFNRKYALFGRIISVLSLSILAVDKLSDCTPLYIKGVMKAMLASILMNIYIGGLNQLTDIEIDKINKPYLPLASGEYSFRTGALLVAISAIVSFCIVWTEGSLHLFWGIFGMFFFGTMYSLDLPLMRWKNSGFLAAVCIVSVWGVIQPVTMYLYFKAHLLQQPAAFSKSLIFLTAFMTFFSVNMALLKDIPDLEGDKMFGVQTFASRLGQKQVFWICIILVEIAYRASIVVGAMSPNPWTKLAMTFGHTALGLILWNRATHIDVKNKEDTQGFYMFFWKLFYAENLLIPFIRL